MVKKKEISQELLETLITRVEELEKKLSNMEKKEKKKEKKTTTKKMTDSLSDTGNKLIKESNKILSSFADATVEGLNESADALSSLSDETDKDKLGEIPSAVMSIFRKTLDIQKKVLEKFEDSYKNYDT